MRIVAIILSMFFVSISTLTAHDLAQRPLKDIFDICAVPDDYIYKSNYIQTIYKDKKLVVPKDLDTAFKKVKFAAEELNNGHAQSILGCYYYNGDGVEKDLVEASKAWSRSARGDYPNPQAEVCLGLSYLMGSGFFDKDPVEAVNWFRKSAIRGYSDAQLCLGWCYENGVGTFKDQVEAYAYYNLAGKDNEFARQCRDRLEKVLTVAQIDVAVKRSKELQKEVDDKSAETEPTWWKFWR